MLYRYCSSTMPRPEWGYRSVAPKAPLEHLPRTTSSILVLHALCHLCTVRQVFNERWLEESYRLTYLARSCLSLTTSDTSHQGARQVY